MWQKNERNKEKPNPESLRNSIEYYKNYYHTKLKREVDCKYCKKTFCSPNSLRSHQISDKSCIISRLIIMNTLYQNNLDRINSFEEIDLTSNEINITT